MCHQSSARVQSNGPQHCGSCATEGSHSDVEARLETLDGRLVGLVDRAVFPVDPLGPRVDSVGDPDDWHGDHVDFYRHPGHRAASVAGPAGAVRHWPRSVHPVAVVDGPDEPPVRPPEDPAGLLEYPDFLGGIRCVARESLHGAPAGLAASRVYHVADLTHRN